MSDNKLQVSEEHLQYLKKVKSRKRNITIVRLLIAV